MTGPAPSPSVLIRGGGVAAACAAHLLRKAGAKVRVETVGRPRVPAIMLSAPALALMRDVFDAPDLLSDLPPIERRTVAWGGGEPVALPHEAVVVSEMTLHARLAPETGSDVVEPDIVLETPAGELRRFGDRKAWAAEVKLRREQDARGCWVEATRDGWLFLIPDGQGGAWLLSMGGPPLSLLEQSRLIAPRVMLEGRSPALFDPCPRLAAPTSGPGWLAIGSGSIGFDPICGDGTAQAVRQGILAAAVVMAEAQGQDALALRRHYDAMLVAALRRHLRLCMDFYGAGGDGPWWRAQSEALVDGHSWCTARLAVAGEPAFALTGFDLVPRELVA